MSTSRPTPAVTPRDIGTCIRSENGTPKIKKSSRGAFGASLPMLRSYSQSIALVASSEKSNLYPRSPCAQIPNSCISQSCNFNTTFSVT